MLVETAVSYFRALDAGEYDVVAELFSADASYVRPQKVGSVERGAPKARELRESVGRDAIREFAAEAARVAAERRTHVTHRISSAHAAGNRVFVEGTVPSPDGGPDVVFFAHFEFDPRTRLIARYAAVANEQAATPLTRHP